MGYKTTARQLDKDLLADPEIQERVKDLAYAHKLYAALCNTQWQPDDVMDILREHTWSASWRTAGGIVAELRDCGEDYVDWYCSGLEGCVHEDIRRDLKRLGWTCVEEDDDAEYGGRPDDAVWGKSTGIAGSLSDITAFNEFLATYNKDKDKP